MSSCSSASDASDCEREVWVLIHVIVGTAQAQRIQEDALICDGPPGLILQKFRSDGDPAAEDGVNSFYRKCGKPKLVFQIAGSASEQSVQHKEQIRIHLDDGSEVLVPKNFVNACSSPLRFCNTTSRAWPFLDGVSANPAAMLSQQWGYVFATHKLLSKSRAQVPAAIQRIIHFLSGSDELLLIPSSRFTRSMADLESVVGGRGEVFAVSLRNGQLTRRWPRDEVIHGFVCQRTDKAELFATIAAGPGHARRERQGRSYDDHHTQLQGTPPYLWWEILGTSVKLSVDAAARSQHVYFHGGSCVFRAGYAVASVENGWVALVKYDEVSIKIEVWEMATGLQLAGKVWEDNTGEDPSDYCLGNFLLRAHRSVFLMVARSGWFNGNRMRTLTLSQLTTQACGSVPSFSEVRERTFSGVMHKEAIALYDNVIAVAAASRSGSNVYYFGVMPSGRLDSTPMSSTHCHGIVDALALTVDKVITSEVLADMSVVHVRLRSNNQCLLRLGHFGAESVDKPSIHLFARPSVASLIDRVCCGLRRKEVVDLETVQVGRVAKHLESFVNSTSFSHQASNPMRARFDHSPVLQAVQVDAAFSDEHVAEVSPREAAAIAEERWATGVQWLANRWERTHEPTRQAGTAADPRRRGDILILEFSRDPPTFDAVLLNSSLAQQIKLEGVDVQPDWANGAKVFVHNLQPDMVEETHVELKRRHVILYEEDEGHVLSALDTLPSRTRPRIKPNSHRACVPVEGSPFMMQDLSARFTSEPSMPSATSTSVDADADSTYIVVVKRTFLHAVPVTQIDQRARTV